MYLCFCIRTDDLEEPGQPSRHGSAAASQLPVQEGCERPWSLKPSPKYEQKWGACLLQRGTSGMPVLSPPSCCAGQRAVRDQVKALCCSGFLTDALKTRHPVLCSPYWACAHGLPTLQWQPESRKTMFAGLLWAHPGHSSSGGAEPLPQFPALQADGCGPHQLSKQQLKFPGRAHRWPRVPIFICRSPAGGHQKRSSKN